MSINRRLGPAGIRRGIRGAPAAGSAAWDPSQIVGVAEWWTDPASGASWVGSIAGETLIQAGGTEQPTPVTRDGQPALSFDGGDYMQVTYATIAPSQPASILLVVEFTAGGATTYVLTGSTSTGRNAFVVTSGVWQIYAGSFLSSGQAPGGVEVLAGVFNSTSSAVNVDDLSTPAASGNAGGHDAVGLTVGALHDGSRTMTGFVWEIVVVDGVISADDLAAFAAYASDRYPSSAVSA